MKALKITLIAASVVAASPLLALGAVVAVAWTATAVGFVVTGEIIRNVFN